jgi:DNA-directed RNA polymerase specialized sigma subunit
MINKTNNNKVIFYEIPEIVRVRKNECDINKFQLFLKNHKKDKTIQEISKQLDIPKSEVEHWFRTDKYFSIPSDKYWYKLKDILKIYCNIYDSFVMDFEEKESVYDQTNRCYDFNGIAPTITATCADLRIIIY